MAITVVAAAVGAVWASEGGDGGSARPSAVANYRARANAQGPPGAKPPPPPTWPMRILAIRYGKRRFGGARIGCFRPFRFQVPMARFLFGRFIGCLPALTTVGGRAAAVNGVTLDRSYLYFFAAFVANVAECCMRPCWVCKRSFAWLCVAVGARVFGRMVDGRYGADFFWRIRSGS